MYFVRYQQKLVTFVIYDNTYVTFTHNYFTKIRAIIKLHVYYNSIDVYLYE